MTTEDPMAETNANTDAAAKAASDTAAKAAADAAAATAKPAERTYAGKYKTPDELEKGYIELQKKIGQPKALEAPAAEGDPLKIGTPPAGLPEEIPDTADLGVVLEKAGLKQDDVDKAFAETGKLTDEQYKAIKAKYNLPRAAVDQFLEGQQAQAAVKVQAQQRIKTEAAAIVGSEAALTTLLSTAKEFIPPDEIDDINARLADPKRFKGALRDVMEFHRASVGAGKSAPLASGQPARTGGGEAFVTPTEYQNAMKEAKKKFGDISKDPGFMARVAATQKTNPKMLRAW
jgi:hypothetical protein